MRELIEDIAGATNSLGERVSELIYDALRREIAGGDGAGGAKELERQLAKVRRSLAKAEQILRELAAEGQRN